jgi:hypothetical protein
MARTWRDPAGDSGKACPANALTVKSSAILRKLMLSPKRRFVHLQQSGQNSGKFSGSSLTRPGVSVLSTVARQRLEPFREKLQDSRDSARTFTWHCFWMVYSLQLTGDYSGSSAADFPEFPPADAPVQPLFHFS